jgi:hypothetical protein
VQEPNWVPALINPTFHNFALSGEVLRSFLKGVKRIVRPVEPAGEDRSFDERNPSGFDSDRTLLRPADQPFIKRLRACWDSARTFFLERKTCTKKKTLNPPAGGFLLINLL